MGGEERRQGYIDLHEKLDELHNDIKEVKKWMLGNGKLGVIAKVNILWGSTIFIICGLTATAIRSFWG